MSPQFMGAFLIALREGTEATLIVGILVAYLVKVGRRDILPALWAGVFFAAAIPLSIGAYLTWGLPEFNSFHLQEILGGTLSIVAVIFITWMIFWFAGKGKELSRSLEADAKRALATGSKAGIVWLAILSVGREALETAIMVWGVVKSSSVQGANTQPAWGVLAGLIISFFIGYLVYKGTSIINLRLFFTVTGYLLIFVAAGILMYGVRDLQEANILPGWGVFVWDGTDLIRGSINSAWFVILNAFFNIEYLFSPTMLMFIAWIAYLVPALVLFTRKTVGKLTVISENVSAKTVTTDSTTDFSASSMREAEENTTPSPTKNGSQ